MKLINDLKDVLNFALRDWSPESIIKNFKPIKEDINRLVSKTRNTIDAYSTHLIEDISVDDIEYNSILNAMLYYVLCTDDYEDGTFCKRTCPNWEHIQTAYLLLTLKNLELSPSKWNVKGKERSIENILVGLINGNKEGFWGEDFYDTCYTCSALLLYNNMYGYIANFNKTIKKSLEWISKTIQDNFVNEVNNKEWYGAAFMGSALYLFSRNYMDIKNGNYMTNDEIKKIVKKLLDLLSKYDKGDYYEHDIRSIPTTPNEWHTSEVLIGLKYYNEINDLNSGALINFNRKILWLKKKCKSGLWCYDMGSRFSFVITGRAIHALSLTDSSFKIGPLINILKTHFKFYKQTGLIYDLPVTINLLLGISAQNTVKIKQTITDTLIGLVFNNMEELFNSLTTIKSKAEEFESKYKRIKKILLLIIIIFLIFIIVSVIIKILA